MSSSSSPLHPSSPSNPLDATATARHVLASALVPAPARARDAQAPALAAWVTCALAAPEAAAVVVGPEDAVAEVVVAGLYEKVSKIKMKSIINLG